MRRLLSVLSACGVASAVACSTGNPAAPATTGDASAQIAVESAAVYVAKVKNVLVGLPPTDAEVKAVDADPSQLGALVDGWMKLPQYDLKMRRFFELAFQQTQVSITDFADQVFPRSADTNSTTTPLFVQNATESFARTAQELVAEGRPFTENDDDDPFHDDPRVDGALRVPRRVAGRRRRSSDHRRLQGRPPRRHDLRRGRAGAHPARPDARPVEPELPALVRSGRRAAGRADRGGLRRSDPVRVPSERAHRFICSFSAPSRPATRCRPASSAHSEGTAQGPQPPPGPTSPPGRWSRSGRRRPARPSTSFYETSPRCARRPRLVLSLPRVEPFFTTPAFFANWQTNASNEMRVTMNQALIVATGAQVDGTDDTVPSSTCRGSTPCTPRRQAPASAATGRSTPRGRSCRLPTRTTTTRRSTPLSPPSRGLFAFEGSSRR